MKSEHIKLSCKALLVWLALNAACMAGEPPPDNFHPNAAENAEATKVLVFGNSATSKARSGDFKGAAAEVSQAIALRPQDGGLYSTRADFKQLNGDLKGAINDYRKCMELNSDPVYLVEERFQLWICESKIGLRTSANHSLSLYLKNLGSPWGDWQKQIGLFLLDRRSESDFLAGASPAVAVIASDQLHEAWYYVAIKRLLNGDREGAMDAFHKCTASGPNDSTEYFMAMGELKRGS